MAQGFAVNVAALARPPLLMADGRFNRSFHVRVRKVDGGARSQKHFLVRSASALWRWSHPSRACCHYRRDAPLYTPQSRTPTQRRQLQPRLIVSFDPPRAVYNGTYESSHSDANSDEIRGTAIPLNTVAPYDFCSRRRTRYMSGSRCESRLHASL